MYVETADDLNRKFGNTYVRLFGELVWIESVVQEGKARIAVYQTNNGDQKVSEVTPEDFTELSFDSMYVNNTKLGKNKNIAATLFKRSPKRQWKRGLGHENTQILCPLISLYNALNKRMTTWDHRLSYALIERMQNPEYPSFADTIDLVDTHQAVAFSPSFCVLLSCISNDKYLIASKHGFIGECDSKHIWVRHQPSEQELSDYVRRSKQNISIELVNA